MIYEFAPLEGITGWPLRQAHAACFPGIDHYYTPFITANQTHSFKSREKRELDPEHSRGLSLIPQILANDPEHFLWTAAAIAKSGYEEVDFNLGCPSPTVVTHGRGAGFLADPERLDRFFDAVFEKMTADPGSYPKRLTVKTRLGLNETAETGRLIEIYNRYPIARVIVHPRLRSDFYKGFPRMEGFRVFYEELRHPLTYNGDIRSTAAAEAFSEAYPLTESIMIGRGLLMNPALVRELRGGAPLEKRELLQYHDRLLELLMSDLGDFNHVLGKMKELWYYMAPQFYEGERRSKNIRKAKKEAEYRAAVDLFFAGGELLPEEERIWRP